MAFVGRRMVNETEIDLTDAEAEAIYDLAANSTDPRLRALQDRAAGWSIVGIRVVVR